MTNTAKNIIETLIDNADESHTVQNLIDALCDGECLAFFGFNDQAAVEEACEYLENNFKGGDSIEVIKL